MTSPHTGNAPAVITLREVYDLVVEVKDSVAIVPAHAEQLKDHETRLRALERKLWLLAGASAVAGGALGNFFPLISK